MVRNRFGFGRKIQMRDRIFGKTPSEARSKNPYLRRVIHLCAVLLLLVAVIPATNLAQIKQQPKLTSSEPTPEPGISAILAAFEKYEIVAMPADHGVKDLDDFILSLIRTPAFSEKVNDISVECAIRCTSPFWIVISPEEDVAFTEVRKVWRSTTQAMCGTR